jgi:TetR/AcrR family transcriptional regulator, regulator of cefoperazone and chloramphenicol sensitivity
MIDNIRNLRDPKLEGAAVAEDRRRRFEGNDGDSPMTAREPKGAQSLNLGQGSAAPNGRRTPREEMSHDLTARVRIRDAALTHFAEEGYERTTIRAIARTAGVSHGMLRHHFGSKFDLRAECDDYVFQVLHRLNTVLVDIPSAADPSLQSSRPLWRYAARTLIEGSPTAGPIFDELVVMTARRLAQSNDPDSVRANDQNRTQAALLAAMASAIPLFQEHLSRVLGIDIFSSEGDELVALTLRDMIAATDHHDEMSPICSTPKAVEVT